MDSDVVLEEVVMEFGGELVVEDVDGWGEALSTERSVEVGGDTGPFGGGS